MKKSHAIAVVATSFVLTFSNGSVGFAAESTTASNQKPVLTPEQKASFQADIAQFKLAREAR